MSTRSRGKSVYYFPGGKREAGETDVEVLCREIKEELDVEIDRDSAIYIGTFEAHAHGHDAEVLLQMRCYEANFSGTLTASSEIDCFEWMRYRDRERTSEVDQKIFDFLWERALIDM
ncbi:NUDIX hydrolase [Persicobacter psychrovividus]|uniref:8-oxo-dGTP diphosphatase n=1 Tax=Persicobacter psychrovividus TaxID=387638 RepID=A0ABM7VMH7_9BACT|nr:DNA mismatch repair protein MutT [Persicobacter psychrovividus]